MMETADRPGVTFTPEQVGELMRLHGAMPYGGGLAEIWEPGRYVGEGRVDAEKVLRWLDGLRGRLEEAAVRESAMRTELHQLRDQRAAVRAFLGTAGE